jgi:HK97 family phage major capsid protein
MEREIQSQLDEMEQELKKFYAKHDGKVGELERIIKANQPVIDSMLGRSKDIPLGGFSPNSEWDRLIESNIDNFQKLSKKEIKGFDFRFSQKAVADMGLGTNFPSAAGSVAFVRPGIITNAARPRHLRDLIPQGGMTGSNFIYLSENGAGEGGVTTVAENAMKPQVDFDLQEISKPAEFIAGWTRISTKMLDDVQSMRAFLQTRLIELLLVVEDNQLLKGDGVSPNLKGINTAGNFTAATGAATIDVEQLIQAIGQLAALGRIPDGIVLNPTDYFALLLNKAVGSGEYDVPDVVQFTQEGGIRIAGANVVWTAEQTAGTFTVGDFANGSLLLFREPPRVEFFREDGTNVRENKVTVRVEERVSFAVFAATYFIKGTL